MRSTHNQTCCPSERQCSASRGKTERKGDGCVSNVIIVKKAKGGKQNNKNLVIKQGESGWKFKCNLDDCQLCLITTLPASYRGLEQVTGKQEELEH